jgi:RHS repeat-associated protein
MKTKFRSIFLTRLGSRRRLASITSAALSVTSIVSLIGISSPVKANAALLHKAATVRTRGELAPKGPTSMATSTPADPSCSTITFSIENYADTTFAMKPDGSAYAWGLNNWGQLGNGTSTSYNPNSTPTEVVGENGSGFLGGLVSIAGSDANGGAVMSDGSVYTWGASYLGDGTTNSSTTPIHVVGPSGSGYLTQATQLSGGNFGFLVLKGGGTVFAWGADNSGQLGNGANLSQQPGPSLVPVQVVGPGGTGFLSGIAQVAAGSNHSLALKSDGTVWAWGYDYNGDLGDNDPNLASSSTPVQVVGVGGVGFLTNIVAVAAGDNYSIAVKSDGTVYAWGDNQFGELGIGSADRNPHITPAQVLGPGGTGFLTGVTHISAAQQHGSAVKSDGTAWTWGANSFGELGNGDTNQNNTTSPVQVVAPGGGYLTNVVAVQGGEYYGAALKSDGTLWAWGWNQYGQLGLGTSDSSAHVVPAQVVGVGGVGYLTGIAQAGPCNAPQPSELLGSGPIDEKSTTVSSGSFPVNTATGNFWHSFTDFAIPGRGLPLVLTRTYNSYLAPSGAALPLGNGWTDSYNVYLAPDPNKTLTDPTSKITVHEENGDAVVFSPVGSGNYQGAARVLGTLQLSSGIFQLSRHDQTHLFFDSSGRLSKETDRNGYATTLTYTGSQLTKVTDPANRTLTFAYFAAGQLKTVTDGGGRSVSYTYDTSGNLQTATDLGGNVTQFGYDGSHRLTTMTDPRLGGLANWYDAAGRVYQQEDPALRVTTYNYDTPGVTVITDPKGNVTQEEYSGNELARLTRGAGTAQQATWGFGYDASSLGISFVIDPAGNEWQNSWDANGNLLTHQDPLGDIWTYTYDNLNDVQTAQDALKVTTTNVYDASGNLKSSSTPLLGTSMVASSTYTYGDTAHPGDLTSVTDADGKVWTYGYDTYGVRNKTVDPTTDTTTYAYDNLGRLTSSVSPKGNVAHGKPASFTTTYAPDAFGRPTLVTDPLGHQTRFHYDADGNVDSLTDANSHVTLYTYNADNQLTDVQRPDTTHLATGFDLDGNVSSQTDGSKNATLYTYDALNRLQTVTDPLNRTTSYSYDALTEKVMVTDPQSRTTTYIYDSANRLHGILYGDGTTPGVGFVDDADGQRQTMTDGTLTSTYTVDSLHRLTKLVTGANQTVSYGYDLKGQLTSITYPGGAHTVTRAYDAAGRLGTVTDWNSHATTYGYDPNSNTTSVNYPNRTTATFAYDNADRLTSIADAKSNKNFLNLTYTPDPIGQTTTESSLSYGYNVINQLAGAGTTTYSYDGADNLHQVATTGSTTTTLVDDVASQLSTFTKMNGSTLIQKLTYGYDPQGNRLTTTDQNNAVTNYTYDQANRLITYGTGASYGYNGDGLRMSKSVSGSTTQQTWDVAEGLPLLLQDGGTSYVTGLGGLPLEQITSSGTTSYYHQDRLGSTRAITNSAGTVVATYTYDAYGNLTSPPGTFANPLQYAGQYTDAESGLQYDRARYYDPQVGGFISRDPAAAHTRQPYAYGANSPVNRADPSGFGILEAGNALLGGLADLQLAAVGVVGQALEEDAFFVADWADTEHDRLVSNDPLAVTVGVLDVFAAVFTIGAGAAPEAAAEKLALESTTALAKVPDFADTANAFEHYAAHVKGIRLGPNGAYALKAGGADMPEAGSFAQYRSAARSFMSGPGEGTVQGIRAGGDLVRFDPASGNFGVLTPQGVIRTFFHPDDGIDYFLSQFP